MIDDLVIGVLLLAVCLAGAVVLVGIFRRHPR